LWEALLRFPNAPLYATHDLPEKPFLFETAWPNFHTMRILGHGDEPDSQIKHVYLLHNGLNETNDLLFHYRLAAWILHRRRDAVCILRPLPGHLTRFPFHGPYAATPLDDYLRDPADLFRQFLRYMLETQWLLSALVPRSQYLIAAGTQLLGEAPPRGTQRTGRTYDWNLAASIATAWQAAFDSNERDPTDNAPPKEQEKVNETGKARSEKPQEATSSGYSRETVDKSMVRGVIVELRKLLHWEPVLTSEPPQVQGPNGRGTAEPEQPCIHVVGYSMGGFVAQAVFFAWPFAVSSCTNLFAGGALRDLAPTAFAHPEEWQAVLHGMRYELDRAFRDKYLEPSENGFVAGIEKSDFGYFTRIFYEVFLQYYRGGYSSRVSEFSRRLLFVVGGDDPIVRTRNVLDAGPPQGVTLLQIADVSHFPGGHLGGTPDGWKVESEQRRHWLPEVGRVIANFSERSEGLLNRTLAECWGIYEGRQEQDPAASEDPPFPPEPGEQDRGMLDSAAFAHEMNDLVKRVSPPRDSSSHAPGWLLVARNEIPPVFLGPKAFLIYGQAVHHSEEQITRYITELRERSNQLIAGRDNVSLLIPEKSERWFRERKERERFFSKSETASAARTPGDEVLGEMWDYFEEEWLARGAVGKVVANEYNPQEIAPIGPVEATRLKIEKLSLTTLPDIWIGLSDKVCATIRGAHKDEREFNENAIVEWAVKLSEGEAADPASAFEGWVASGEVVAIAVSAAELNPRYRGRRLLTAKDVQRAIIHWALAYRAAKLLTHAEASSDS
jgi:hypothetical protein